MTTTNRIYMSERIGRWLGQGWRVYARGERWVHGVLVSRGVTAFGATTLLWVIKLSALALLLYAAFWLTVWLTLAFIVVWAINQNRLNNEFELKDPITPEELRETPGYDPDLHEDTAHEMYRGD